MLGRALTQPTMNPGRPSSGYGGFPPFAEWRKCSADLERWERANSALRDHGAGSSDLLRRARLVIRKAARACAVEARRAGARDRGASRIEGMWDMAVADTATRRGPEARSRIESQLPALAYVMDFAVRNAKISEKWIRGLHSRVCLTQKTYSIRRADGTVARTPLLSEYKRLSNHVVRKEGLAPLYAPAEQVAAEMRRYCGELRGEAFLNADPITQASYAHYALAAIHPFADGNGRAARALAFAFIYRSNYVPTLALADARGEYLNALALADAGDFQPFIDLVLERAVAAATLTEEGIRQAARAADEYGLRPRAGGARHAPRAGKPAGGG